MTADPPAPIGLFSYGTLQQPQVQLEVFGRRLEGAPDTLPGHRRVLTEVEDEAFVASSGAARHATAVPSDDPADEVAGTLFEVTEADLAAADAYEPAGYGRSRVTLKSGRIAWLYVKT